MDRAALVLIAEAVYDAAVLRGCSPGLAAELAEETMAQLADRLIEVH